MPILKRTTGEETRLGGNASSLPPRPGSILTVPGRDLMFLPSSTDLLRFREDIGREAAPVPTHRHLWQTEG